MKIKSVLILFCCIMAAALSAGLVFSRNDQQSSKANVLITSSHTQASYEQAAVRLAVLDASLNELITEDAALASEDFSLTMLSANLYNLAINTGEPLTAKQVMAITRQVLHTYDRRIEHTFAAAQEEVTDLHNRRINQILYEHNHNDMTAWYEPLPGQQTKHSRAGRLVAWLLAGLCAFALVMLSKTRFASPFLQT